MPFGFLCVFCSRKVTQLFAQYLQHSVMTIGRSRELLEEVELLPMLPEASCEMAGQMVMQTGFNLWLSSLFLTRGEYFKAQILRHSSAPLHWLANALAVALQFEGYS